MLGSERNGFAYMRFLIVGPIHHHAAYARALRAAPPDAPPLFPPTQSQYFYVRELRALGHEVSAFHFTANVLFGGRALLRLNEFGGSVGGMLRAGLQRFPRLSLEYMARNRRLVAQVRRLRPDWVWVVGGTNIILPDTLVAIKALGARLMYNTGVSPVVFALPNERKAARLYDLAVTNDFYHAVQWLELGTPRAEALPYSACAPDFHYAYALSDADRAAYGCDVAFVGTLLPEALYSRRVRALEALRDLDLGIWSVHPVPASLRPFYRGKALGTDMLRITCAAKIVVNPHGDFMRWGGNMRLFEASGCGAFQIADALPGVAQWFEVGKEIITYRDPRHLRELVGYYLENTRARAGVAAAGQARAYAEHTYAHRTARLLELLEQA